MPRYLKRKLDQTQTKTNKRFKNDLTQIEIHKMAFENRFNELKWTKSRAEYLEVKKNLESYNWRGDTPLIAAIRGGAIDFVEELVENNINVNQPGFLNETASMVAAQFNQLEIAELLQFWFNSD